MTPVDVARDVTSERVDVAPMCAESCAVGTTRCTAGTVETCASVAGCTRWGDAMRCNTLSVALGRDEGTFMSQSVAHRLRQRR